MDVVGYDYDCMYNPRMMESRQQQEDIMKSMFGDLNISSHHPLQCGRIYMKRDIWKKNLMKD